MGLSRRRPIGVTRWAVWSLPRRVLFLILTVELVAIAAVAASATTASPMLFAEGDPLVLAVLAGAGIISTEASLGVERARHRREDGPHIDLSSVWAFAAAALLPGLLACAVVVVISAHLYARSWRKVGVPPYRVVFSVATVLLAVHAAGSVLHLVDESTLFSTAAGLVPVVLAVLTYAAINMFLVVAAIAINGHERHVPRFVQLLRHGDDAVLEFATLSMGALVAGAMSAFGAYYAVLVLPPLIVLHRTVLVRQLEEAASIDGKTGLLNAAAWHAKAGRELRRAERAQERAAVLVLDLDHFKLVNDRHGHLVGDTVLAAVAAAVRAEVRDDDLVGRFGGEEFVVLLRGVDVDNNRTGAEAVAERIRRRIAALEVEVPGPHGPVVLDQFTVSIGGAVNPPDDLDLARLIATADTAMYEAKHRGRNRVRMGLQPTRDTA
ncbi:GGDEF domain-containing protein [Actinomycetes bacterium KLBMP 9759]